MPEKVKFQIHLMIKAKSFQENELLNLSQKEKIWTKYLALEW